jgi:Ni,Fe-hydrogenase III small subunit/ferredoxin
MFKALTQRIKQGYRTYPYPARAPVLPERFQGRPVLCREQCRQCGACQAVCPVAAINLDGGRVRIDMGKCLFCRACVLACPAKAIEFSADYRLCARARGDLVVSDSPAKIAEALDRESRRVFGRSLKLRQVSAGGCNACEADANVLTTLAYDLGRFGIQFVASPRHADGLLVTGPVTCNMRHALLATYEATPAPRFVIAVGACAISGGPFADRPEAGRGVEGLLPIDLYIPGCPPHPYTILDGLLTLLGRL